MLLKTAAEAIFNESSVIAGLPAQAKSLYLKRLNYSATTTEQEVRSQVTALESEVKTIFNGSGFVQNDLQPEDIQKVLKDWNL